MTACRESLVFLKHAILALVFAMSTHALIRETLKPSTVKMGFLNAFQCSSFQPKTYDHTRSHIMVNITCLKRMALLIATVVNVISIKAAVIFGHFEECVLCCRVSGVPLFCHSPLLHSPLCHRHGGGPMCQHVLKAGRRRGGVSDQSIWSDLSHFGCASSRVVIGCPIPKGIFVLLVVPTA